MSKMTLTQMVKSHDVDAIIGAAGASNRITRYAYGRAALLLTRGDVRVDEANQMVADRSNGDVGKRSVAEYRQYATAVDEALLKVSGKLTDAIVDKTMADVWKTRKEAQKASKASTSTPKDPKAPKDGEGPNLTTGTDTGTADPKTGPIDTAAIAKMIRDAVAILDAGGRDADSSWDALYAAVGEAVEILNRVATALHA